MLRSSYRRMLDRGRKAGLNAHELYRALAARQPAPGDDPVGRADNNGYVAQVQENGQRTYQQPPGK
jgi:hypothetical protein